MTVTTRTTAPRHLRAMWRVRQRFGRLCLAAAGITASMVFGPALLGATAASAASTCGAPVAGSARVVVVVDDGVGQLSIECILVSRGTTGSQLLRQRATMLGTALPGHAGSGLLCTIDSFPASGCAETSGGSYWANFSANGGSWDYSDYNPFIRRVCDGDVEGWRYVVRGTGSAGDAAPRIAPDAVRPDDARGCEDWSIPSPSGEPVGTPEDAVVTGARVQDPSSVPTPGATVADPATAIDAQAGTSTGGPDLDSRDASAAGSLAAQQRGGVDASSQSPASQSASTSWIGLFAVLGVIGALGSAALLRSRRSA